MKKNINKKTLILLLNFILTIIIAFINHLNENNNKFHLNCKRRYNLTRFISNKWIVITTINSPSKTIFNLLKISNDWKIVVVGDKKTNDKKWRIFRTSNKLIYLSLNDQFKLCYHITKYIPLNSYSRKNIGYLYAIENGAKEIYEIDDNINILNDCILFNNIIYDRITYFNNNNSFMINPYSYFGHKDLWPRGFRLRDIGKDFNNKFFNVGSNQINLKPLIYQGLINVEPDIDSMLYQTRVNKNNKININFTNNDPLIYLPGNYVPINSKNTKYLYKAFPFLLLPISLNQKISDILRGYLIQRCIWGYNGTIFFYTSSSIIRNRNNYHYNNFIDEKDLYFKLDNLLETLNLEINKEYKNPTIFLLNIIKKLVIKKYLNTNDLLLYKSFLKDLNVIGFTYDDNFSNIINYNEKYYINITSHCYINQPIEQQIFLKNNLHKLKLLYHNNYKKRYDDILLIINYNYPFLTKINNYIFQLYKKSFPHIIFLSPSNISTINLISCLESYRGYYMYICFKKIYQKYPNMKGYLLLNDDIFLKIWELENYDFNIPWFNKFAIKFKKERIFKNSIFKTKKFLNHKFEWKNNLIQFLGEFLIPKAKADFLYFPNLIFLKMIKLIEEMYKMKIFLEIAIPTAFAIMLLPKYYSLNNKFLKGIERKANNPIIKLKKFYYATAIHPIKFLDNNNRKEVIKYIYFINGKDF